MIFLSTAHSHALLAIMCSGYYKKDSPSHTIEIMIEEHLLRENGRLGTIKNGKYEERK